jgi:hypothetical protein
MWRLPFVVDGRQPAGQDGGDGKRNNELMKTFELRCEAVLNCVFHGMHHAPDIKKVPGVGGRWECNTNTLSTYDFDGLTRLVVAAHDQCVRASVAPSGPGLVKIMLHDRQGREGEMSRRHPTMEHAVASLREGNYGTGGVE